MSAPRFAVKKTGTTWSVVRISDLQVVEGGFWGRSAAVASCLWYEANTAKTPKELEAVDRSQTVFDRED